MKVRMPVAPERTAPLHLAIVSRRVPDRGFQRPRQGCSTTTVSTVPSAHQKVIGVGHVRDFAHEGGVVR